MPTDPIPQIRWMLGLLAWGDLDGLTWYRNKRGNVVVIAKTWPEGPPSDAQLEQRAKFKAAVDAWKALTAATKHEWKTAASRAWLCMHGCDLFLHWKLMADDAAIRTIERQTGTTLLP